MHNKTKWDCSNQLFWQQVEFWHGLELVLIKEMVELCLMTIFMISSHVFKITSKTRPTAPVCAWMHFWVSFAAFDMTR
jgi:hypothetical protein